MEKDNADIVYLNLSNPFDTLSHYCLLETPPQKNFGISKEKKNFFWQNYESKNQQQLFWNTEYTYRYSSDICSGPFLVLNIF